jgi:hypothetical protein
VSSNRLFCFYATEPHQLNDCFVFMTLNRINRMIALQSPCTTLSLLPSMAAQVISLKKGCQIFLGAKKQSWEKCNKMAAKISGTDVMIFRILSPKNLAKKLAFLTQNKAKF